MSYGLHLLRSDGIISARRLGVIVKFKTMIWFVLLGFWFHVARGRRAFRRLIKILQSVDGDCGVLNLQSRSFFSFYLSLMNIFTIGIFKTLNWWLFWLKCDFLCLSASEIHLKFLISSIFVLSRWICRLSFRKLLIKFLRFDDNWIMELPILPFLIQSILSVKRILSLVELIYYWPLFLCSLY